MHIITQRFERFFLQCFNKTFVAQNFENSFGGIEYFYLEKKTSK